MVERNERRVRRVRRWDGVSALARELGLSRCFVSQVLNGHRRSARVEAAARARGGERPRAPRIVNRESCALTGDE